MRVLQLCLRALWWRRGTSTALLAVATFATAAAAAGPVYAAAAQDAVLHRALASAPPGSDGTGLQVTRDVTGRPGVGALRSVVDASFAGTPARRAYPAEVVSLERTVAVTDGSSGAPTRTQLVHREHACAHVRVVSGTCLAESDPTGALVTRSTAVGHGWSVGTVLQVPELGAGGAPGAGRLVVRGVYEPAVPDGAYWAAGGHGYFPGAAGGAGAPSDAVLVPQSTFSATDVRADEDVEARADLLLDVDALHARGVGALQRSVDAVGLALASRGAGARGYQGTISTGLGAVLERFRTGGRQLAVPVLVVTAQLVVLAWYVLFTLASSAAEARGGEIALAKLRGLPARVTAAFAVGEVVVLLLAAVPLGVAAGLLAVQTAGRGVLGPTVDVHGVPLSWLTAAAAAAGGVVAAVGASAAVLRRPVLGAWRRAGRRPPARAGVADAVVAALALAGLGQLWSSGSLGGDGQGFLAVLAPGLLGLAGALVGARLLPLVARAGLRRTRASRSVGAFVAVRQVARRPTDLRVFGVLTTAVTLAVFAASSQAVFASNRGDRAGTEVGAARVLHVVPGAGVDVAGVVARLDPRGRSATAVFEGRADVSGPRAVLAGGGSSPTSPTLLVVDPDAVRRVGFWRRDFTRRDLAAELAPLQAAPPSAPLLRATALRVGLSADIAAGGPARLSADLTTPTGHPVTVALGTVGQPGASRGATSLSAPVPDCAGGCRLRRLYLAPAGRTGGLVGALDVLSVDVQRVSGWVSATAQVRSARWTPLNPAPGGSGPPAETASASSAPSRPALSIRITAAGPPGSGTPGFGAQAGVPASVPALVTPGTASGGRGGDVTVSPASGQQVVARPVPGLRVLPRAGGSGVLVARSWWQAASPGGYDASAPNEVWLSAAAPAGLTARLRAAGVAVVGVESTAARTAELGRQGPELAVDLLLAGAVVAVALAVAATVVTLHLLGRRRIVELAAMRTLGIRTRTLVASATLEQALLVVPAALAGALLGVLGARVALPVLPEYVDQPGAPPIIVDQPVLLVGLVAAGTACLVLGAAVISAVVLARAATPGRLREPA